MNSRIREHYHRIMKERNVPLWKQQEAIYTAVRCEDKELLEMAIKGFPLPEKEDEWKKKTSPAVFALREMASEDILNILLDNGHHLAYPGALPFNGSPEEVIRLVMRSEGLNRKEAIHSLSLSVFIFLERMGEGISSFRTPTNIDPEEIYKPCFLSYLDSWLSEFILLLDKEASDDEISIPIAWILEFPELIGAFKAFIKTRFFDEDSVGWYMSRTLSGDNEKAFSILLDMADGEDLQNIDTYPRTSIRLLNQLFDRGVLIPGTDKAFEAFDAYIAWNNKVDEEEEPVLRAIMHPSYGNRRNDSGNTILINAILNKYFEPYLYPVLVTSSEELNARNKEGRTALYYLAISAYPECLEVLMNMGAIPFCVDEKGDNVLHVLLEQSHWIALAEIEDIMRYLPKELITMRNAEGKTPMDIFMDKLKG